MGIEVTQQPNLSLDDMRVAMENGTGVVRSAHIGNLRGYNLAVASMGIPMLLVDHNIVAQFPGDAGDNNYLPGSLVTNEDIQPLNVSRVGGLALQTTVKDPSTGVEVFLDELHVNSLRSAFPGTKFVTNTNYIREFADLADETIAIATQVAPQIFRAVVEADGTLRREPVALSSYQQRNFASLLPSYGTLQLATDPRTERGVLMPNEVDIVINFMIEALKSGSEHQIHLSGPDMQLYMKNPNITGILQSLYQGILEKASFKKSLPETLRVDLVPADQARFVGKLAGSTILNAIFDATVKEADQNQLKGAFMRSPLARDTNSRAIALKQFKAEALAISTGLSQLAKEADELFVGSRQAPYLSQYDVLSDGGMNMPTSNRRMTMQELKNLFKRLVKMRGQLP